MRMDAGTNARVEFAFLLHRVSKNSSSDTEALAPNRSAVRTIRWIKERERTMALTDQWEAWKKVAKRW